jgi:hypothetical protein
MMRRQRARDRIDVRVPENAGAKLHRELGAFARYCIGRVERELGKHAAWSVTVSPALDGYSSRIAVSEGDMTVEDRGTGHDGTLAVWDAMCRIEQRLREQRH